MSKSITVRLMGGMGNQMYQYAYARHIALLTGSDLYLDNSFLDAKIHGTIKRENDLNLYNIRAVNWSANKYKYCSRGFVGRKLFKLRTALSMDYIEQKHPHHYNPKYLQAGRDTYLNGYWQSFKLFDAIRETLLQDFAIREYLPLNVKKLMQIIQDCNSVCINVRRKDFVNSNYHVELEADYYIEAFKKLQKLIPKPIKLFIFSDDIEWCKKNLTSALDHFYVEHSFAGDRFQFYHLLMRECKHFIIPNSSFGWWAAYLSESVGKVVIAPKKWYHGYNFRLDDVLPKSWLLV